MKNIMVTGGCGFIGSVFIRHLLLASDFDGRIINVDKLTYAGNPENLVDIAEKFPERYDFIKADICDSDAITRAFDTYRIDAVCNFAAESHVDRSIVAPDAFIKTNIDGTFALLEVARQHMEQLKLFHHVSTDEVYGSLGTSGYFTEQTPYRPNSPYSASKAASDHLVRAYSETYALPITLSNCSNNYGPYQFPEKLIPLMILNALEGQTSRRELISFVKDRPGHDLRYAIDCSKLEKELGWKPRESFDSGLRKTIQWYLDNPGWVERVRSGEYRQWIKNHYE